MSVFGVQGSFTGKDVGFSGVDPFRSFEDFPDNEQEEEEPARRTRLLITTSSKGGKGKPTRNDSVA